MSDIDSSLTKRKIIHVDMDAFYASVEMRDDHSLLGKPVIVGGGPNSRGVVATANYEARRYGIRSAMPSRTAYAKCPHAIFLRPRFDVYRAVSHDIRAIFRRYTDLVEPLSLDEAYLDVTGHELPATEIARLIKQQIRDELSLTASAGVAPNKMVAKIASEIQKPDGLTVVKPHAVFAFIQNLPVRRIPGIGPVSEKKLASLGIVYCRDVLAKDVEWLNAQLGERMATWLNLRARGLDHRPVETTRDRKSYGHENTFASDLLTVEQMNSALEEIAKDLASSMQKRQLGGRTITLKIKSAKFVIQTRAMTLSDLTNDGPTILNAAQNLLLKSPLHTGPVRLLGISMSRLEQGNDGS